MLLYRRCYWSASSSGADLWSQSWRRDRRLWAAVRRRSTIVRCRRSSAAVVDPASRAAVASAGRRPSTGRRTTGSATTATPSPARVHAKRLQYRQHVYKTSCKTKPDVSPPGYPPSRLRPFTAIHYFGLRPASSNDQHRMIRTNLHRWCLTIRKIQNSYNNSARQGLTNVIKLIAIFTTQSLCTTEIFEIRHILRRHRSKYHSPCGLRGVI